MGFEACSRNRERRSATTASRSRTVARRTVTLGAAGLGGEAATEHILTRAPTLLLYGTAVLTRVGPRDLATRDQRFQDELAGGRRQRQIGARRESHVSDHSQQTGHGLEALVHRIGRDVVGYLQRAARVEPHHDLVGVHVARAFFERGVRRPSDEFPRYGLPTDQLPLVLQLDLPGDRRERRIDIGDARYDLVFAHLQRSPFRIGYDVLQHGDRHALRYARASIDSLIDARLKGNALDDLGDKIRYSHSETPIHPSFLGRDLHAKVHGFRVVSDYLTADPIFERRDDLTARGIVFRIRGEAQFDIEWEPYRISFDLDIALLHDIEQSHLDFPREIRQLIQGEDASIRARQHAVMD